MRLRRLQVLLHETVVGGFFGTWTLQYRELFRAQIQNDDGGMLIKRIGIKSAVVVAALAVGAPVAGAANPGNAVNGKKVFVSTGCGACHTLKAAAGTGVVGPNLDKTKPAYAKVIDRVTNGKGAMTSYKAILSKTQIQDVAAFVSTAKH